jgi:hypothetical protein
MLQIKKRTSQDDNYTNGYSGEAIYLKQLDKGV